VVCPASEDRSRENPSQDIFQLGETQYRDMIENFPDTLVVLDRRGVIRIWNASAQRLTGYPAKDIVGRSFVEAPFLRLSDMPRLIEIFAASLKRANRNPVQFVFQHADGSLRRTEMRIEAIKDRRRIIGLQIVVTDLTRRDWFEEALRESEEKFRTLIENSLVGNYIQQDFIIRFCNRTFAEIFGYNDPTELIGLHIRDVVAPESWPIVSGEVGLRVSGEKEFSRYEFTGRKRDGSEVGCEVLGARIMFKGQPAIQGSIIDITERRKTEEKIRVSLREKEVLLREVYHRTKNNMQVISSLLNLQARKLTDPKAVDMFRDTQQRIRTMALVHERLYRSQDLSRVEFGVYLHNLTTHLFHFFQTQPEQVRLEMETSEVPLDIQSAIPCGLLANEIISNALKHAFPEGRKGTIFIRLTRDGEGLIVLSIRDDGIGLPDGLDISRSDTLGMEIVTSLVGQIDGRLEILRDQGTEFRISFREIPYAPRIPE
jgi:PAS domain S-box-containing protein